MVKRKLDFEKESFSINEAAAYLGVAPNTVRALVATKRLRAFNAAATQGMNKLLRIKRKVLEDFTEPVDVDEAPPTAAPPRPLQVRSKVRESEDSVLRVRERMEEIRKGALEDAKRKKAKPK